MNLKNRPYLALIALLLLLSISFSCRQAEAPKENIVFDDNNENQGNQTFVKLPSPVDYYILLRNEGADFKADALPGLHLSENATDFNSKAYALGVISSSILYLTVFEQNYLVPDYFKQAIVLSQELGLSQSFNSQSILRIQKNIHSVDSLREISNQIFQSITLQLENPSDSLMYSLVLAGGWFQSFYTGINSENTKMTNDQLGFLVSEQTLVLENLLQIMNFPEVQKTEYYQILTEIYQHLELYSLNENGLPTKQELEVLKELINKWKNQWIK